MTLEQLVGYFIVGGSIGYISWFIFNIIFTLKNGDHR